MSASAGQPVEEAIPKLLMGELGPIPDSVSFPAPRFDTAAETRDAAVISSQASRMMGKEGEEGFIITMSFQYNGRAQPTVGVLIAAGAGVLTVRGNLFMLMHKPSGKPLAQAYAEKLIPSDRADPRDFESRHWQVMKLLIALDATWTGLVQLARELIPKLFEATLSRPQGDPLPSFTKIRKVFDANDSGGDERRSQGCPHSGG